MTLRQPRSCIANETRDAENIKEIPIPVLQKQRKATCSLAGGISPSFGKERTCHVVMQQYFEMLRYRYSV